MEYKIRKPAGTCVRCSVEIPLGDVMMSTIVLEAVEPVRQDYCIPCFTATERPPESEFAFWKTRRAGVKEKKRVIDFPTLRALFFRMIEQPGDEYRKICYLLALLLMRKRLLALGEFVTEGAIDYVVLTAKDRPQPIKIEAPTLRAEEMLDLRDKLTQLLDVDLEGEDDAPVESKVASDADVS